MLDAQLKRGLLERCVLAVLCRGDSHGYRLIKDLSECITISESTLYPILRRLEAAGSLTVSSVEHNGRLRKIYHLTEQGRAQLGEFLAGWTEVDRMLAFIREEWQNG